MASTLTTMSGRSASTVRRASSVMLDDGCGAPPAWRVRPRTGRYDDLRTPKRCSSIATLLAELARAEQHDRAGRSGVPMVPAV